MENGLRKEKEGFCKCCNQRLKSKESSDNVLLICINIKCRNHWSNQGCEIIMMLK